MRRYLTEPEPFPEIFPGEWGYDDSQERESVAAPAPPSRSDFATLCDQVESGDPDALHRFRHLVDQDEKLLSELTDLVSLAKQQTISVIAGESIVVRELMERQLARDTEALLGHDVDAPLIERMQAEILLLSRMESLRCHVALSRNPENQSEVVFWTSAAIRAQRRFERALQRFEKTLAIRTRKRTNGTNAPS